jgi:hypothetical protein
VRCFKVIQKRNRRSVATRPPLGRVYQPGEPVRAVVGGLLCFKTEFHARKFIKAIYAERSTVVVQAEGRYPVKLPPRRLGRKTLDDVRDLWHGRKDGIFQWPDGTAAFEEVTCKK